MAIAIDNSAFTSTNSSGTSRTLSYTTSGSDRALLLLVGGPGTSITGVSCTYAGVSMTQVGSTSNGYAVFYLANPATGTNNIVASWTTSNIYIGFVVVSLTGVHQTTPLNTYAFEGFLNDWTDRGAEITTTVDGCGVFTLGGCDNGGFVAGDANSTLVTSGGYSTTKIIGIVRSSTFPQTSAGAIKPVYDGATNSWGGAWTVALAPASGGGYAGSIKSVNGTLQADIKSFAGTAIADIKSINGVSNIA